MGWRTLAAMLTASAMLAPVAMAQGDRKCADAEFDSHSVALDEVGPFAGASAKAAFARTPGTAACRVIAFYRIEAKPPEAKNSADRRRIQQEYATKTAPPFFAARYVDDKRSAPFKRQSCIPKLLRIIIL